MAPRIVAALSPFMASVTEDSLALVLEALSTVVQVDGGKWLTPELATQVVQLLLQTYARNANGEWTHYLITRLTQQIDPISLSITTDIFTFLASAEAPGVYQATVMATIPMVAPTIANNDGWVCCSAMQILTAVFEGAKVGQLGDGVVAALAPSLFVALGKVNDPEAISVSQNCSEVIFSDLRIGRMSSAHIPRPKGRVSVSRMDGSFGREHCYPARWTVLGTPSQS